LKKNAPRAYSGQKGKKKAGESIKKGERKRGNRRRGKERKSQATDEPTEVEKAAPGTKSKEWKSNVLKIKQKTRNACRRRPPKSQGGKKMQKKTDTAPQIEWGRHSPEISRKGCEKRVLTSQTGKTGIRCCVGRGGGEGQRIGKRSYGRVKGRPISKTDYGAQKRDRQSAWSQSLGQKSNYRNLAV